MAQVGNKDTLNCYYAHCQQYETLQVRRPSCAPARLAEQTDSSCLQRRCYWMLDSEDAIVLVHYLDVQTPSRSRQVCNLLCGNGSRV